jgi:nitrogen fixation NifU-like protein
MDFKQLYQDLIIDHSRSPRNCGSLESATCSAEGLNPLCGDKVTIHLIVKDGVVVDARFEGKGCAISTASASLLTEAVKNRTCDEVEALFKQFQGMVTGQEGSDPEELGKLAALEGVKEFPMRVKCATLAWHTLRAAMKNGDEVTTE